MRRKEAYVPFAMLMEQYGNSVAGLQEARPWQASRRLEHHALFLVVGRLFQQPLVGDLQERWGDGI